MEIAGCFSIDEITHFIPSISLDEREIRAKRRLQNMPFAIDLTCFLALGHDCPKTRGGVKSSNAGAPRAHAFRQSSLRHPLHFELFSEDHCLKSFIFPSVG